MIENNDLIQLAKEAAEASYAPYSKFCVGAAIVTENGKIFKGCNVENASYGATNCAERTAIFKAVSEGYRSFSKIAVVAKDGVTAYPCGICLQVMQEFMPNGTIVLEKENQIIEYQLKDLLPNGFTL